MKIEFFYGIIKAKIEKKFLNKQMPQAIHHFMSSLETILKDSSDDPIKITKMTILFEGFYHSIPDDTHLKNDFLEIRFKRWEKNNGIPTVPFLLSYQNYIDKLKNAENYYFELIISGTRFDFENNVVVDEDAIRNVEMPRQEITGQLLKTYNSFGGYTTTPCDPYSQAFLEYVETLKEGRVLEIGAGFGSASLQALSKGVEVYCNDIDPKNLAVVSNRYFQTALNPNNLVLIPGSFPDELAKLPSSFFDAILICRVLHFFSGKKIEKSLEKITSFLKPGGKLFVICETPFLKNWQSFIPVYEKNVSLGIEWPGEIDNPTDYETSGRVASLPPFVHWITKDILDRTIIRSNLKLTHSSYIDRKEQFPHDLLLNGNESVGAIAERI